MTAGSGQLKGFQGEKKEVDRKVEGVNVRLEQEKKLPLKYQGKRSAGK